MTPREKAFWWTGGGLLFLGLTLLVGLKGIPFMELKGLEALDADLDTEIARLRTQLNDEQPTAQVSPAPENLAMRRIEEYKNKTNNLKTLLEEIKSTVSVTKPLDEYAIAPNRMNGSRDDAASAWNVIYETARNNLPPSVNPTEIPYDLGMSPNLFQDKSTLDTLQYQLSMLHEFAQIAKGSDILKIEHINYLEPQETGVSGSKERFIREYPVTFDMECTLPSLIRLLYSLKASATPKSGPGKRFARFFIVRNLTLAPQTAAGKDLDRQTLKVSITVAVMKFTTKEQTVPVNTQLLVAPLGKPGGTGTGGAVTGRPYF